MGPRTSRRSGLTLVETTMAALAVAALLGICATLMQKLIKTDDTTQTHQNLSTTLALVLGTLQDTSLCAGSLRYNNASPNLSTWKTALPQEVPLDEIRVSGSALLLSTKANANTLSKTGTVQKIALSNPKKDGSVTVGASTLERFFADLTVVSTETLANTTTTTTKILPIAVLADPTTSDLVTCGTPDALASSGFGSQVSDTITIKYRDSGPYSALVVDSSLTDWNHTGVKTKITGNEWAACFLTGVYLDPNSNVSSGIDAHTYRISKEADGNYFFLRGHILNHPEEGIHNAEFDVRCLR